MAVKEELIRQCRYYKGEEQSPFEGGTTDWFWDMERVYVQCGGLFDGERGYYENINGKRYPDIPFDLLIVMFTSWGKWTYSIKDSIGSFYELMDEYRSVSGDSLSQDKVSE